MKKNNIKTPCIGICSTVYGDVVCRGCKRFSHEIINWNQYSNEEKKYVWNRLEKLQKQILEQKIEIVEISRLKTAARQYKSRINLELSPFTWAFLLLTQYQEKIQSLEECGLKALPKFGNLNIKQLTTLLNEEYYQLSQAYFDISYSRHQPKATAKYLAE